MAGEFDGVWRRVLAAATVGFNVGIAQYAKHQALARHRAGRGIGWPIAFGLFATTMGGVHVQLIREMENIERTHPVPPNK